MDPRPLLLQLRLRGKIANADPELGSEVIMAGHARERGGHLVLTPEGRIAADAAFAIDEPARSAVATAYEHFLPRNAELIQVCNDWQVRPGQIPNDHRDPTYDWKVIDRLNVIDDRIGPVIRRLGTTVAEFAGYRPRLREARAKVDDGEHDWLTSPRLDSYHTVWMELHEHLLVALAIERGLEQAGEPVDT